MAGWEETLVAGVQHVVAGGCVHERVVVWAVAVVDVAVDGPDTDGVGVAEDVRELVREDGAPVDPGGRRVALVLAEPDRAERHRGDGGVTERVQVGDVDVQLAGRCGAEDVFGDLDAVEDPGADSGVLHGWERQVVCACRRRGSGQDREHDERYNDREPPARRQRLSTSSYMWHMSTVRPILRTAAAAPFAKDHGC